MGRVRLEGWPSWSAHPFVVLSAGGMCGTLLLLQTPSFVLPAPQKWQLDFLVTFCPEFALTGHAHSYFSLL